jgi:VCBS repeat-containing protein
MNKVHKFRKMLSDVGTALGLKAPKARHGLRKRALRMEPLECRLLLSVSASITRSGDPIAEDGGQSIFTIDFSSTEGETYLDGFAATVNIDVSSSSAAFDLAPSSDFTSFDFTTGGCGDYISGVIDGTSATITLTASDDADTTDGQVTLSFNNGTWSASGSCCCGPSSGSIAPGSPSSATVTITDDDGGGTGPEIEVWYDSSEVDDGSGPLDLGSTPEGSPQSYTFTIYNWGEDELTLDTLTLPAGFVESSSFASPVYGYGGSTTFVVELEATTAGTYGGQVSFNTNDLDESPFNFTITGEVSSLNSAPTLVHPIGDVVVEEGTVSTVIDLSVVFDDVDIPSGDSLTLSASHDNADLLSTSLDGSSLTLSYVAGQLGAANVTVRATDQGSEYVEDVFTATVIDSLQQPVAFGDTYQVDHDTTLSVDAASGVLTDDFDPNGDVLEAIKVTDPSSGTLTLNADGSFTYTPDTAHVGPDSFTYRATDGTNDSNVVTVTIDVTNHVPAAGDDAYEVTTNSTLTVEVADGVLANDFDLEGDALAATVVDSTVRGVLSLAEDGSFTYTPEAGFEGSDSFTYQADDGVADSTVTTVTIQVTNDAPAAVGDWYRVTHDVPLVVEAPGVLQNDLDAEGDSLTATLVDQPANGTVVLNPDGSFTYTPGSNHVGSDSFTYKAEDAFGQSESATVTLEVINNAPVGRADVFYLAHDTTLVVDAADGVLSNDSDGDEDSLSVTRDTDVSDGTLTLGSDGAFTYVPDEGFAGSDSFTYLVSDGLLTSGPTTVVLNVSNTAPCAFDDTFRVHAGNTLSVTIDGVLANDFDADDDALTALLVTDVTSGTLNLGSDGLLTYTPNGTFTGSDTFTYKANDQAADSEPATVTIEVTNTAPWAVDLEYSFTHDTTLSVDAPGLLDFAGDADDDSLTASLVEDVASGSLTLNADGSFTYTPTANSTGTESFQFKVNDGFADSEIATVTLSMTNTSPIASNDYYSVSHDRALTVIAGGVLENDSDPDGDSLSTIPQDGVQHGTLTLNADGSFTYTPMSGYVGSDQFTYRASDGVDGQVATVSIEVVNAVPQSADDVFGVLQNQALSASASEGVLANDSDFDGDSMTVSLVDDVSHGSLTLNSDGSFSYTPESDYLGTDSFTYKANDGTSGESQGDGNTARVTITVYADAVVAEADEFQVNHDTALAGDVLSNDFNWNQVSLTAVLVDGTASGLLTLDPGGSFTYTPNSLFVGSDSFTYQLDDGGQLSNIATVTIDVVNSAPEATGRTYRVSHGQTLSEDAPGVAKYAHDAEGDALTVSRVDDVTQGSLLLMADGSFTYTPNAPFVGEDSFTFKVSDGIVDSDTVTVTIEVTNEAPLGFDDVYEVNHGNTLSIALPDSVLANDLDWDGDSLTAERVDDVTSGQLTLNADGTFTYTPNTSFAGQDTFTYKSNDGLEDSSVTTVTLNVVNTAPAGFGDSYEVLHDQPLTPDAASGVLVNDVDREGDAISAAPGDGPLHGTVTLNADGSFTYTPETGYVGDDSFTYRVGDGFSQSDPVTVQIAVTNTAPVANDDAYTTDRNATLTVGAAGVLANDVDLDGDTLTLSQETGVTNGTLTLNADGSFTYTPANDFVGNDSFTYSVFDGVADAEIVTVEIEVANAAPEATADSYSVPHDTTLEVATGDLFLNDFDANGDTLTASLVDDVTWGTLALGSDGSFTYTPNTGFVGFDRFSYLLSDGFDQSEVATVAVEVVNSRPLAQDDWHRVLHDATLNVAADSGLLALVSDAEEDTLSVSLISDVNHGTLTIQTDGSYTYTPNAGFVGADSFTYQVSDSLLSSTTAKVSVDVANSRPSATGDVYTVAQDNTLTVAAPGVLANDGDLDGETITATLLDGVSQGTLTLNADGSFSYTPPSGYAGIESFTYKVSDGIDFSYGRVFIEVAGTHANPTDVPTARNDFYRVSHGQTLEVDSAEGLLVNDVDPNGDSLEAVLVAGPSQGSLTWNADGSFEYTPTVAAFVGTDSFTYKANDGSNDSGVATVTIEVVNSIATADNAVYQVHQGTELAATEYGLTLACFDGDGDQLTTSVVSTTGYGTLTPNGDGTFTYTPQAGYTGTDSFTYKVNDGVTDSNTATVVIDVTNHAPFASDGYYQVRHDEDLAGEVLSTAGDLDGDALTAERVTNPARGSVVVNADGSFTYTPEAGYAGRDSFTFRVRDGAEWSPAMTVDVEVLNTAPAACDTTHVVHHGGSLTARTNSWDADGDALTLEVVDDVDNGTLTVNPSSGDFTYVPTTGYVGTDSFQYKVTDGVADSSPATVTIEVTNIRPLCADLTLTGSTGESVGLSGSGLLDRAWDGDGDSLTLVLVSGVSNGTLVLHQDGEQYTGGFTYTPQATFSGVDTFSYKVDDGAEFSDPATVTLAVSNSAPRAFDGVFHFHFSDADSNGAFQFDLGGDQPLGFDGDEDPLTYSKATEPTSGSLQVASDGSVTYTPSVSPFIGTDTFTYEVSDGFGVSNQATITIRVENVKPIAADDYLTTKHGEVLTIAGSDLLKNDFDFDGDAIEVINVSAVSDGTLTYDSQNDQYVYDPGGFVGTATFTYQVDDGAEQSQTATASIDVVNTAPWAVGGSYQVIAGETLTVPSLTDRGAAWDLEGGWSAELVGANPIDPQDFDSSGSFTFSSETPGTYTVNFKVSDGKLDSDTASIHIEVVELTGHTIDDNAARYGSFTLGWEEEFGSGNYQPNSGMFDYTGPTTIHYENTRPMAASDSIYKSVHGQTIFSGEPSGPYLEHFNGPGLLFCSDFDPDDDALSISLLTPPSNGTVTINPSGHFQFEPGTGPGGYDFVGRDSFEYEISDGHGGTATAWCEVEFYNHPPEKVEGSGGDVYEKGAGGYITGVPVWDRDVPETLTFWVGEPTDGSLEEISELFNTYYFTPPYPDWTGTATFEYIVTDGAGATCEGTASITIVETLPDPPPPPILDPEDDEVVWSVGSVSGNALQNDGGTATNVVVSNAGTYTGLYGTLDLAADGTFTYTITPGEEESFFWGGGEGFTYVVDDGEGHSASANIAVAPNLLEPGKGCILGNGMWVSNAQVYSNGFGTVGIYVMDIGGTETLCLANILDGTSFMLSAGGAPAVAWTGPYESMTSYLWLSVEDGDILDSIAFEGYLKLTVDGDVGDIQVDDVRLIAYGNVGSVDADRVHHIEAESVASVNASSHVYHVFAEQDCGPVTAGGHVGRVVASFGDIASVQAGGAIEYVHAGHDITGPVTAQNGDIGFFSLGNLAYHCVDDVGGLEYGPQMPVGGVKANHEIQGAVSAPAGNVSVVHARHDIQGGVSAGGNVYFVCSNEGSIGGAVQAGGHVGVVDAGCDVTASVSAGAGHVVRVESGRDITGNITAALSVNGVEAGRTLSGNVTASGGSVYYVYAGAVDQSDGKRHGKIDGSTISASESVDVVTAFASEGAGGDISGSITATAGFIRSVTAHGSLDAVITADKSIGKIEAGVTNEGGILQSITSNSGSVAEVTAHKGGIDGTIRASLMHVGEVWARDSISQLVTAGESVVSVTSETGDITAVVGPKGIGTVSAGRSINADVQSTEGGIGEVTAGTHEYGDILGNITAKRHIYWVQANGQVPEEEEDPEAGLPEQEVFNAEFYAWLHSGADPSTVPIPARAERIPMAEAGGDINGSITSQEGSIGGVVADGKIAQHVTADKRIYVVWARDDVDGNVSSNVGSTVAVSWGTFTGTVQADRHIVAFSYDDFVGDVLSTSGAVVVDTWGAFRGRAYGPAGTLISAYGEISSPSIESTAGPAGVRSYHDATPTKIEAARSVGVAVLGAFDSNVVCFDEGVYAASVREMAGSINSKMATVARSLKSIAASIIASDAEVLTKESYTGEKLTVDKSLALLVLEEVSGASILSKEGDIYIEAGKIVGAGNSVTAAEGAVGIKCYGNVEAAVRAKHLVTVSAIGHVTGQIASDAGSVFVLARPDPDPPDPEPPDAEPPNDCEVSAPVTAHNQIGLVSWGVLSGALTTTSGNIYAFAHGEMSGVVNSGSDAELDTWDSITSTVDAVGNVDIFARRNVRQDVTAGGSVEVVAGEEVAGEESTKIKITAGDGRAAGLFDAKVVAMCGSVKADVTASMSATVQSLFSIEGDVNGRAGNAFVSALETYTGTVNAGVDAVVVVGGQLTANSITAGNDVRVAAGGEVAQISVTAGRNAMVLSDKSIAVGASGSGIQAGGDLVIGALEAINAPGGGSGSTAVHAGGNLEAFAGTTANLKAKTDSGDIELTALGQLQGDFEAGASLFLASYAQATNLTGEAKAGSATVIGATSLTVTTVEASQSISALSLGNVQGTFDAQGSTSVMAGGLFNGTAEATGPCAVTARTSLSGTVNSRRSSAAATATGAGASGGDVAATVTGYWDAASIALLGNVTGPVTATLGNASVLAGASLSAAVSAGKDASVWTLKDVATAAGSIAAGANAMVMAYGQMNAPVNATNGGAIVIAGKDVTCPVTGKLDVRVVSRTGSVMQDVTSQEASAAAVAAKDVGAEVHGSKHAVAGALGNVLGNVTADTGHALALSPGGYVAGSVSAALSATVVALDDVTGQVSAGTDAVVASLAGVGGTVTAGRDALLIVADTVMAPVTAERHAVILGTANVAASVTATTGDAVVITLGDLTGTVSAGDSAFLIIGGNTNVTANATVDAYLLSFGTTTAMLNVGQDGFAWSGAMLSGYIGAGRDAVAVSLASSNIGLNAGRDAFVWVFDVYQSNVIAGQDAFVVSCGGIHAGVTAGRDAGMFSIDYAIGSIDAERYAGMATWGTAAGPMVVDGEEGAFGWAYRGFNGEVRSANGNAFLGSYGNAVGNATAGRDALVAVVGDFTGRVEAAEYAGAVTLGDFTGSLSAGAAGFIFSEGNVHAGMTTGDDLAVSAVGDVTGNYHAGRDAAVVTYADFSAALTADRDIGLHHYNYYGTPGVWARGDISGRITAGRNIGHWDHYYGYDYGGDWYYDIFAFGDIDAVITANNPSASPIGGRIGSVGAVGPIDGLIKAAHSIGYVCSGDAITATIIAPYIGSVAEFNSAITAIPYPETPDSIKADVLAEAALVYDQVLADKALVAADIADLVVELATVKAEVADSLAEARAKTSASVTDAKLEAQEALDEEVSQEWTELYDASSTAGQVFNALGEALAQGRADLAGAVAAIQAAHAESRTRAEKLRNGISWSDTDSRMEECRNGVIKGAQKEIDEWPDRWKDMVIVPEESEGWKGWLLWALSPTVWALRNAPQAMQNVGDYVGTVLWFAANADQVRATQMGFKELLMRQLANDCPYVTVQDVVDTYKLPKEAAAAIEFLAHVGVQWMTMGPSLVSSSASISTQAALMKIEARRALAQAWTWSKACREATGEMWCPGKCFVGDTEVVLYEADPGFTVAAAGAVSSSPEPTNLALGAMCLVIGAAGAVELDRRRRKQEEKEEAKRRQLALDALFDADGMLDPPHDPDDESPPVDDPLPQVSGPEFEALCDQLFCADEPEWQPPGCEPASPAERAAPSASPPDRPDHSIYRCKARGSARAAPILDKPTRRRKTQDGRETKLPLPWRERVGVRGNSVKWGGSSPIDPQPGDAAVSTATVPKPKSRRVGRQTHAVIDSADRSVGRQTHEPRSATRSTSRQTQPRRSKRPRRLTACLWAAVFGLLGAFLLSRGIERPLGRYAPAPAPAVAAAQQEYVTKPIRDIQVGEWVLAENPELTDAERAGFDEIDPATWRKMSLRMEKSDGSLLDIDLLRPARWLKTNGVAVGSTIHLDLPEIGAAGPAEVLSVAPCPEVAPRPSPRCQIVTGKFSHSSGEILDVHVEELEGPIGTTANHPFWSEDRQDFVEAGRLEIGERLRTHTGDDLRVSGLLPRPGPELVHNLEVGVEHVYHVSPCGVLVHNAYHRHHSIPKNIQERLPRHIREHRDIIGRKGLPNRMLVESRKHLNVVHDKTGYRFSEGAIGGGAYCNQFWDELNRTPRANWTVPLVLEIRDELVKRFDL